MSLYAVSPYHNLTYQAKLPTYWQYIEQNSHLHSGKNRPTKTYTHGATDTLSFDKLTVHTRDEEESMQHGAECALESAQKSGLDAIQRRPGTQEHGA